jgi:hypothetical protein
MDTFNIVTEMTTIEEEDYIVIIEMMDGMEVNALNNDVSFMPPEIMEIGNDFILVN